MNILLTGATGFVGQALSKELLRRGHRIYALSRRPMAETSNLVPITGDITRKDLGIMAPPADIDAVVHSAALLSFKPGDKDRIYETNYQGTVNVVRWMKHNKIHRLYHVSTAYLFRQNPYETSKEMAEEVVLTEPDMRVTVFRPSVIIGDSRIEGLPPMSGFYLGIRAIDQVKRWVERETGLPPIRVKLRVAGDPECRLNLIPIDVVVYNMVRLINRDAEGIFHLTHPYPPPLKALEEPISLATGADVEFVKEFTPNLAERLVAKLITDLAPYLRGSNIASDIWCRPLTGYFLRRSAEAFLSRHLTPTP